MPISGPTYRNLEIHDLLSKGRHVIVEAEPVLSNTLGSEHKVALSLLGAVEDNLFAGADNGVIDIEGTARLDL